MSDETLLGTFADASGEDFEVIAKGRLVLLRGDQCSTVLLGPEARDTLRELLDRSAMPGQPGAVRYPLYGCCEHCEHCGNDQCKQPGRCHHGYEQPPHLRPCVTDDCEPGHKAHGEAVVPGQPPALAVAAVTEDFAERVGELADAAQQAACRYCLWDIFGDPRGWRIGFGGDGDPWHCEGHPGGHQPAEPGELAGAAQEAGDG